MSPAERELLLATARTLTRLLRESPTPLLPPEAGPALGRLLHEAEARQVAGFVAGDEPPTSPPPAWARGCPGCGRSALADCSPGCPEAAIRARSPFNGKRQ